MKKKENLKNLQHIWKNSKLFKIFIMLLIIYLYLKTITKKSNIIKFKILFKNYINNFNIKNLN